ncbi:hypothetical protein ACR79K_25330 [Sphingobacterium siyangense]|uniref:hypothetical protein n=1 Tax=Sphingobacterium siyangense TaxID=459529 RepID=UPI003DA43BE5
MKLNSTTNLDYRVSTVLLPSGEFETMVFDPRIEDECECLRAKFIKRAEANHKTMVEKYSTSDDVVVFAKHLDIANDEAQKDVDSEDGGTCNLDSLTIDLSKKSRKFIDHLKMISRFSIDKIESKMWKGSYFVGIRLSGQGNRRSRMVERASKYLKSQNIDCSVYYQMD